MSCFAVFKIFIFSCLKKEFEYRIAKYDTRAYEYTLEECNYSCVNFCKTLLFCPMKSKETAISKLK
jgi:hypothetical protein